jgi:ATP-binding cassette subfamily B (MDR/TAP) protein 1
MTEARQASMSSQVSPTVSNEKPGVAEELAKPAMAGLTDEDREIIEIQTNSPKLTIGYFSLFRYANKKQALIMAISAFASIVAGAVLPLMTVSLLVRSCLDRSILTSIVTSARVW